jgi:feruloyl esterase
MEKTRGLEKAKDFFILYMVPGMAHCQIPPGVGPDNFDLLTALEDWVEKGVTPKQIVASQLGKEKQIVRTRPLCPYPEVPKYKGTGSTDDAAGFICERP